MKLFSLLILSSTALVSVNANALTCQENYLMASDWEPAYSTISSTGHGTDISYPKLDLFNRVTGEMVTVFEIAQETFLTRDLSFALSNANENPIVMNKSCRLGLDRERTPWTPSREFLLENKGVVTLPQGTPITYRKYWSGGGLTAECLRMPIFHVRLNAKLQGQEIPLVLSCKHTAPDSIQNTFTFSKAAPRQPSLQNEFATTALFEKSFLSKKDLVIPSNYPNWIISSSNADGILCSLAAHRLSTFDRYLTNEQLQSMRRSFETETSRDPAKSLKLSKGEKYKVGFLYGGSLLYADLVNIDRNLYFKVSCTAIAGISKRPLQVQDLENYLRETL